MALCKNADIRPSDIVTCATLHGVKQQVLDNNTCMLPNLAFVL